MTGFKLLPWDTEFFGHRIATATEPAYMAESFHDMLDAARDAGVECLYLLVGAKDSDTARLAETAGFHLVDIRLTFNRKLDNDQQPVVESPARIRPVREEETDTLVKMSHGCFADSRFYHDPHFTKNRCDALYETWVQKSCKGWADKVLVAELDGGLVGFISCHLKEDKRGKIGLVYVSADMRRQGIGKHLVDASLVWFLENGANRVDVVTQGRNVPAQQLYQRCGFFTASVELWFHKWFV